jgi:GT2 family glycosyltransferase
MNGSVAAIVPHWNRRGLLETLLVSLRAQTRPFDQVIVVDNGSSDDSVELATGSGARVVRLGSNLGFAAAVNRTLEVCQTEWVAILNNDVTLAPDWLMTLLDAAEREQAWFATGKLLRAADPSILDGAFDEISRGACAWRCGAGKPDSRPWNEPRPIRFAPMTAALFRRKLFDEIGLLDEVFESYLEDVEFGLRCALAGRAGIYVPAAVGLHRGSSTLGKWNSDTERRLSRNQVLLAAKYFRGQPRWPILAGQLLWGLIAFRHAQGISYLRGKISGLRIARAERSGNRRNPINSETLRAILESSESTILELQRQTGFDWYWRAYFWLSRR